jgi:hypothetical protein
MMTDMVNPLRRGPIGTLAQTGHATSFVILGSIVIPLVVLALICWYFWTHRHDD